MEEIKEWLQSGSINIFGKPFAGKDTVCQKLSDLLKGVHISGGGILRTNQEYAATQVKVEDGTLAPSNEFLDIMVPYISQDNLKGLPLILNTVGRWHGEENGIVAAVETSGHPLKAVLYLDVSDAEVRRRWEAAGHLGDRGKRKDDHESVLDKRLDEFRIKTLPVLDYYKQKGLLITINGNQSRGDVMNEIISKLQQFINKEEQ